ncbi:T9SS type A sorting domain-containing protein [Aquimarina sp. TRL1]|nr:fibronectin type III domain-containing protein [Aquimarina sp. TRL1]QKX04850.1 T9SS type A sorting domain-containing protein [Aquimarina sp. TRL1]
MKKTLIALIGLTCGISQAQFNPDAPWVNQGNKAKSGKTMEFQEVSQAFDSYWKNKDHTKKGSGYKPFMRWREYWKHALLPDGTVPTPQFFWNAWEQRKKMTATTKNASAATWTPMGPFDHNQANSWSPGQGRVNVAIIDPNNPSTFYVGAPGGGIWKSTDRGANWTPLSDKLPQIGVSGIAIDPNNSKVIYISTGDDDTNDNYSIGVLKSTDGGASWNKTGLTFTSSRASSNDIYIDPNNSNTLWVATDTGVYKTTNAGTNWTKTLNGNIKDIKLKPGNSKVIYAVTSSNFYKSTDGGNTFSQKQSGLPSRSGRLVIDITPANPEYVYVLSANTRNSFQGLYKSTNSGESFTKTQETQNIFESTQAWYDLALGVSDKNPDIVFVGCLNVWKSTNGGNRFTKINNWSSPRQATYTHADIHFLRYYNGKLFCGSDGGVYLSENDGSSFNDLTKGLQIGQFYRISVAQNSSANRLVGGLQDNGGYALNGTEWNNYYGADGMDCAVSGNNSNTYYGFIQNGQQLYVTTNRGVTQRQVARGPETGNWITPLVSDKNGVLYAGYSKFYKVSNNSFQKVSNFNFGGKIDHIELDPNNANNMYVARDRNLYKSTDKGVNWSSIHTFQTNISSVEVHNDNSNIIYVTTSGSGNGGVFKSTNQGTNFSNIAGGLPGEAKIVVRHQKGTENIYLGTYLGVYYKSGNNNWVNYSSNLPTISVRDLEVNLKDQVLIAATYGRGVWKVPLAGASGGDTQAPTTPTALVASNISSTSLTLSWNAATDNVGVTGYDVYQGSTIVTSVSGNSATITGLTPNTSYQFRVRAKDAAGNQSALSDAVSATTSGTGGDQCTAAVQTFPYNQGFENSFGSWKQSNNDNIDWSTRTGQTPSNGTGPSSAHQGSYYIYVEASVTGTGHPNKRAILTSPCFDLTNLTQATVSFNYHMYGDNDMGSIALEASKDNGANWVSLWSQTGNKGNNWLSASIDLSAYSGGTVQLRFNRLTGATWKADIAIDNFALKSAGTTGDICDGIEEWRSGQTYQVGDKVTYRGYLFERIATGSGWKRLGACGTTFTRDQKTASLNVEYPPVINKLVIEPNPIKGNILHTLFIPSKDATYSIIDIQGKIIREGDFSTDINVTGIPKGVYILKVLSDKKEHTQRFIK